MTKTTRDEIEIDLDGSIDGAIATLRKLKKQYPDGSISLENVHEYGESYARLKLHFERPMEPIEIELREWEDKRRQFQAMLSASMAYTAEGDEYPRADELAALKAELGTFADRMVSLTIMGDEIVTWGFMGSQTRDGQWRAKTMGFDMFRDMPSAVQG